MKQAMFVVIRRPLNHSMFQKVSSRHFPKEDAFRPGKPHVLFVGKSDNGTGFPPRTPIFPCPHYPTKSL